MENEDKKIVLPCAKGSEQVVAVEAATLGLRNCRISEGVVYGTGNLIVLYRLCLWSRVASRVLLVLEEVKIENVDDLYAAAVNIEWEDHLSVNNTFAVRFSGMGNGIVNSQFGAYKIKDAIVDRLRNKFGSRPNVALHQPDMIVDVHLRKSILTITLDISGGALHKRGYRCGQGEAPLKETLAALLLYRSGLNLSDLDFIIDPMCGSGTLLIEAIMMAADIAPAINRRHFGFNYWQNHHPRVWKSLYEEAILRKAEGIAKLELRAAGFDNNPNIIRIAKENAKSAGLDFCISFNYGDVADFTYKDKYGETGLIVSNPPYGQRMGTLSTLTTAYADLGNAFKTFPANWKMTLISNEDSFLKRLKLRSSKKYTTFNGTIEAKIVNYERLNQPEEQISTDAQDSDLTLVAQMFANRLQKNSNKLRKWAQKIPTNAFRLYDRDLPEYAVTVDCYADYILVNEYAPPKEIPQDKAEQRLLDVLQAIPSTLAIPAHNITVRTRSRQRGNNQYKRLASTAREHIVREGQAHFYVNLHDYLDTGLFLDHRPLRLQLFRESGDKRFLNLFCYTATASVQAALGGASYTTSVDLSANYLEWAQRNFDLNSLSSQHRLEKADVMQWLDKGNSEFDIIFCDPPTFSNTKKKQRVFDIQTNHNELIRLCMNRLSSFGILYFSTNFRDFHLDMQLNQYFDIKEITELTIDEDFKRNPKIHRVWKIQHKH